MSENVFANEWVECLEAHYMHVIRTKDKVTEPSLSIVMHSAGFSDAQLAELRVRATMHIDDVGADFVPDLEVLDAHNHEHAAPEVAETHIYNIPIDIVPDPVEIVPAVEAVLPIQTEDVLKVEAEPELIEEVETLVEPEAELQIDNDEIVEADVEPESVEEDEAPVEPEAVKPDPDAPQQLSLF